MKNERKEELKDEMKNRISLALKDPILQQGFEVICKENAELRKVAEFQQSSNMSRHFENKKLKEGLAVGSTFNKALNSMNKNLEEERNKYRNMVFDLQKENAELKEKYVKNICDCDICDTYCNSQLIKAKEIIKTFLGFAEAFGYSPSMDKFIAEAEQFISEVEK